METGTFGIETQIWDVCSALVSIIGVPLGDGGGAYR